MSVSLELFFQKNVLDHLQVSIPNQNTQYKLFLQYDHGKKQPRGIGPYLHDGVTGPGRQKQNGGAMWGGEEMKNGFEPGVSGWGVSQKITA